MQRRKHEWSTFNETTQAYINAVGKGWFTPAQIHSVPLSFERFKMLTRLSIMKLERG